MSTTSVELDVLWRMDGSVVLDAAFTRVIVDSLVVDMVPADQTT